jgi:hypothetical protein
MTKIIELRLVSDENVYATSNCQRFIWGFDKNNWFVAVKLVVLAPEKKTIKSSFECHDDWIVQLFKQR